MFDSVLALLLFMPPTHSIAGLMNRDVTIIFLLISLWIVSQWKMCLTLLGQSLSPNLKRHLVNQIDSSEDKRSKVRKINKLITCKKLSMAMAEKPPSCQLLVNIYSSPNKLYGS